MGERLLQLILGEPWRYAKDGAWLFMLALALPLWQIIAGFGHHTINLPVIGDMFLWKLLVLAALAFGYVAWTRARTAGLLLTLCLVLIATTGKSATTQALAPVITLFVTNLLLVGLGTLLWTGTIFGFALVPGQQTTVAMGLQPAAQNFQSFMVFAFWLNLTAFAIARAGHLLPVWFLLTMLSAALIIVPGTLAITGRGAFLVAFQLTSLAFVVSLFIGLLMAFQQLGVVGPWDELTQTGRTFLWEVTDLKSYWLAWLVALVIAGMLKPLVYNLNIRTTTRTETRRDQSTTEITQTPAFQALTAILILQSLVGSAFVVTVLIWLFHSQRAGLWWLLRMVLPYTVFPIQMPMIYTPNQAFALALTAISVVLLLYKAVRGEDSKISWNRIWLMVVVLWIGVYGGQWVYGYMGRSY
jgi:hypothetical protein